MKNGISTAGLAELAAEIGQYPEQGLVSYGIGLNWTSGTRAQVEALPMRIGDQRVSRGMRWEIDEPRQLGGSNHAPNPQEYLLSGLAGCLMVGFMVGASVRGIQVESLAIEVRSELDLAGFLGVRDNAPVALGCIRYTMTVAADAPDELLEELRAQAQAHSPNAMTLLQGVRIEGSIRRP
jgi:uncharacterized OsmC-like protein